MTSLYPKKNVTLLSDTRADRCQEFFEDGLLPVLIMLGIVLDLEAGMTLLLNIFHMTKIRLLW